MHQSLCLFAGVKLFYALLEQQLEFYVHTLQGLAKDHYCRIQDLRQLTPNPSCLCNETILPPARKLQNVCQSP
jgi:hypothetical protein